MKRSILTLALLLAAMAGRAQVQSSSALVGSWSGKLKAGLTSLTLVLHLEQADGFVKASFDSPDQGATDIPAIKEYLSDDSLAVKVETLNMTFRARLKDDKLSGKFTQNGFTLPLVLTRGVPEVKRPQHPLPPFPYTTEEVTFRNEKDSATLAGTLTWPVGYGPKSKKKPVVVLLVSGSGQQNRDEELMHHKPFLVIADYLARQGIASLRYDDRATGASVGGEVANATTEDFSRDAAAGLKFLRKKKAFSKVGLLGHSEGGSIAFMLGAKKLTDFIVTLAGPGVKGDTLLTAQSNRILRLSLQPSTMTVEKFRQQEAVQRSPWIRWFIDYDPSDDIRQTRCPVFALNGDRDCQVISSQNLTAIQQLLPPTKQNLCKEYPALNHLFQHCTTGLPNEYSQIEETISPEVLSDISQWVNGLETAANNLNHETESEWKPRLVVCTDIAPADVEPDDMQSMVRLMAYADLFEIEALITSVGWNCDPYPAEWAQYLHQVIGAYRKDVPNLMKRSGQKAFLSRKKEQGRQCLGYWPSADYLQSRAVMGSVHGGIKVIGEGNDSPGSDLLIRLADEDDPRPIYVAAWGGANTLAQAIWRVKQTRTDDEVRKFVSKFRIYTITDQDMQYNMRMNRAYSSHQWLRREFQDDLQFIWDEGTWQEQCELGKRNWQQHKNHIQGKGALGKVYPDYKWGVEGDTPSFLYVMPSGLNDPDDPQQAGWAGYHERRLCADSLTTAWTSWQEPLRSISVGYKTRFYPDELNDFKARMQWASEGQGNRNPLVLVHGKTGRQPVHITAKAGETIRLDASKSGDPDGDKLSFHWWQQPEIGLAKVTIDQADQPTATAHIPADASEDTIHIICEVHDDGPFRLVAYRRFIINIKG